MTESRPPYPEYFTKNPDYKQFAEQASRTVEVPNVPNSITIWQTFRDAWSKSVIFGQQDPGEALDGAVQKVEQLASQIVISRVLGKQPIGSAFVTPYLVFLAAVFAYPLGFAVYMSFHDYFFAAPGAIVERPFVGFENYAAVLSDPAVRRSFANVGIFLLINVPLTVVLSLLLAYGLNAAIRWRGFFRVSYYVPYVTASVAVVGVWLFLFNSDGLVNSVLGPLAPDPSWLVNSKLAMPTVAVYVTWKQLGFFILLYLAALQNVSKDLYEAASMDGAGRWKSFLQRHGPRRAAGHDAGRPAGDRDRGEPVHRALSADRWWWS